MGHNWPMDANDAEIRATLNAKAAEMSQMLAELTRPIESDATIGFGKRIGDGTTQAIQQMADASAAQSLASLLEQVRRAGTKLTEGSYGRCDVCNEQIGAARLEFRPWSIECVQHA